MKRFPENWRVLTDTARRATEPEETAPFGFSGRVLEHGKSGLEPAPYELVGRLAWRVLGCALPLLVIIGALEWPHLRRGPALETRIENTVAQIVWRL